MWMCVCVCLCVCVCVCVCVLNYVYIIFGRFLWLLLKQIKKITPSNNTDDYS